LFVVSGKHRSRFFRTDSEPLEDWESLATVSGLDGFEPRTLWILRRRGP
jgi:hypothetical protein